MRSITDDEPPVITPFTDVVFTFTGFRDTDLLERLTMVGAKVKDTFSKTITNILVKRDDGPVQAKEEKAIEAGIQVWTKSELLAKMEPYL